MEARLELEETVRKAQAGDSRAFGTLVEAMWRDLVALARGIVVDGAEAEDLTQEALLSAWRRLDSLRDPGAFGPWVRRIVARRSISRARRRVHHESLDSASAVSLPTTDLLDVRSLFTALSPHQRAALYLSSVRGLEDREIASMLGMVPATVRVHRWRARRRLARLMGEIDETA